MVEKLIQCPIIETNRLLLREVKPDDLDDMFAIMSDPAVARHMTWQAHKSKEQTCELLNRILTENQMGGGYRWAIELKSSSRFIGYFRLHLESRHNRTEAGYWLGQPYWGQGYATEALRAVIRLCFESLGVNRVGADHFAENPASGRVMEKADMEFEGVSKQFCLGGDGQYHDCRQYAITRDSYMRAVMRIEQAGLEQAEIIGRITSASWQAAYRGIVPDEYLAGVTPEYRTQRIRTIMPQRLDIEFYVVYVSGSPAGMFDLLPSPDETGCGEIGTFYFLPEYWGKGYATEAMHFALGRLREMGYSQATLWAFEENTRARRFYEKQGFVFDGGKQVTNLGRDLTDVRYRIKLGN